MELKEKVGDCDMFNVLKKMGRKKLIKKINSLLQGSVKFLDVFQFINKKLGGKKGNIKELIYYLNFKFINVLVRILEKEFFGRSDRNLNVQLFKIEEEIRIIEREFLWFN